MSISITETVISADIRRMTWTGGGPTYYVYIDGRLVAETTDTYWNLQVMPGEVVQFEVLDDSATAPQPAFPGRMYLSWRSVDDAIEYRVDQYVDSEWVVSSVIRANGSPVYETMTAVLADVTTHAFRVVPIDAAGNAGTPLALGGLMVRYPDSPVVTTTWDSEESELTVAYE